jgi:hypothetical protein
MYDFKDSSRTAFDIATVHMFIPTWPPTMVCQSKNHEVNSIQNPKSCHDFNPILCITCTFFGHFHHHPKNISMANAGKELQNLYVIWFILA